MAHTHLLNPEAILTQPEDSSFNLVFTRGIDSLRQSEIVNSLGEVILWYQQFQPQDSENNLPPVSFSTSTPNTSVTSHEMTDGTSASFDTMRTSFQDLRVETKDEGMRQVLLDYMVKSAIVNESNAVSIGGYNPDHPAIEAFNAWKKEKFKSKKSLNTEFYPLNAISCEENEDKTFKLLLSFKDGFTIDDNWLKKHIETGFESFERATGRLSEKEWYKYAPQSSPSREVAVTLSHKGLYNTVIATLIREGAIEQANAEKAWGYDPTQFTGKTLPVLKTPEQAI